MILFDTHLLIWGAAAPESLPDRAKGMMEDEKLSRVFSLASIWEVSIKTSRHRAFGIDPASVRQGYLELGFTELPIRATHMFSLMELPPIHSDPFDRMLVAQAKTERLTLLTRNKALGEYGPPVEVV